MKTRVAFAKLLIVALLLPLNPVISRDTNRTDGIIYQKIRTLKSDVETAHNVTRVLTIFLGNEDCISSKSIPIFESPETTCPCFLQYSISSDKETTWDVLMIPSASYTRWKAGGYVGDPDIVVEEHTIRQRKTMGRESKLGTPATNVYVNGSFILAIRTNTDDQRCFNSPISTEDQSVVVFQAMPLPCKIASQEPTPRIVGGVPVSENSEDLFKWMALIWRHGVPVCGGSQISPGYIATAAHCLIQESISTHVVSLGAMRASIGTVYAISRTFTHPNYEELDTNEQLNDITILELKAPDKSRAGDVIQWNWDPLVPNDGAIVTAAGYGHISENWPALPDPNHLLRVDIPAVARKKCKDRFKKVDNNLHLCAGYESGGCDSCQADSGGPLQYVQRLENGNRIQLLVGIISFGSGCARSEAPGVYTRVSTFAPWINETLTKAIATRSDTGFFSNTGAVAGLGGLAVGIMAIVAGAVFYLRCYKSQGPAGSREQDGSDVPSMTGISG